MSWQLEAVYCSLWRAGRYIDVLAVPQDYPVVIHELEQIFWLDTPRGLALAKFLIDRGIDSDNEWICVINETGEVWSFDNSDVRASKNITIGRRVDERKVGKSPSRPPRSMSRLLRNT